jgi:hypothetical protein
MPACQVPGDATMARVMDSDGPERRAWRIWRSISATTSSDSTKAPDPSSAARWSCRDRVAGRGKVGSAAQAACRPE